MFCETVDWFDPETWKVPAALAEHWQKIAVAFVAIVGAFGTVLKWGGIGSIHERLVPGADSCTASKYIAIRSVHRRE
jgi:hypothetical protein